MDSPLRSPQWTYDTIPVASSSGSLAAAALHFASAGIPVFPCVAGGKEPLTVHGFKDASADPRRIASWWRRHPDANVGLPTGAASGVDVVDIDVHGQGSGFPALKRAREAELVTSWVWVVRTPSGGAHAYFPHPHGSEQRSWQSPRTHIDFRGDGGYVIAPPSRLVVEGQARRYEVIAVAEHRAGPVDAARLRRFVDPTPPPRPVGYAPVRGGADPERLANHVRSLPQGQRNGGLFWAACRMVEAGFDVDSTLGCLGAAGVDAGLSTREAETTVRSAFRHTRPAADLSAVVRDEPDPPIAPEAVSL
ncbi:bifunctional DNA primase/polymerase [Pengzhenrongella sicca]|uniref:Bifunctional DNA primase/polymerase n=1 Tax=Pengzhenrongella sicca TaxID=2819238 RepID=A0A8A4Z9P2_9MICO|nr:bifunctional DNA primase/polymerase [Pengzhenrongella sicca]QTE28612.1 bifunctional DNA primase/polymerase [Pengzhenrongella sicca]